MIENGTICAREDDAVDDSEKGSGGGGEGLDESSLRQMAVRGRGGGCETSERVRSHIMRGGEEGDRKKGGDGCGE